MTEKNWTDVDNILLKLSFEYRPSEEETAESRDPWDQYFMFPYPHASLRNAARDGRITWDEEKNRSNVEKHGIGFEKIREFEHPPIINITLFDHIDPNAGARETRIGQYINIDSNIYVVIYVWRGANQEIARVITLHRLGSRRRRYYDAYIRDPAENLQGNRERGRN